MRASGKQYTTQRQIDEMMEKLNKAEESTGKNSSSKIAVKIAKWTGTCLFSLLIVSLLFVLGKVWLDKSSGQIPQVFGYQIFRVETESMVPTLPVGSIIVSRTPADSSALTEGTIITFYFPDGRVVTHRIIEVINEDGQVKYQTKGDNPVNDPDPQLVTPDDVIAEYCWKVF